MNKPFYQVINESSPTIQIQRNEYVTMPRNPINPRSNQTASVSLKSSRKDAEIFVNASTQHFVSVLTTLFEVKSKKKKMKKKNEEKSIM